MSSVWLSVLLEFNPYSLLLLQLPALRSAEICILSPSIFSSSSLSVDTGFTQLFSISPFSRESFPSSLLRKVSGYSWAVVKPEHHCRHNYSSAVGWLIPVMEYLSHNTHVQYYSGGAPVCLGKSSVMNIGANSPCMRLTDLVCQMWMLYFQINIYQVLLMFVLL